MARLEGWLCYFALSWFTWQTALATSYRKAPFKRVHTPINPSVRLLRRQGDNPFQLAKRTAQTDDIQHSDTFLLRFVLDSDPVSILLRPNEHLVHPNGIRVNTEVVDPATGITSMQTTLVTQESVRAYQGVVIEEQFVERYWSEEVSRMVRPRHDDRIRGFAALHLRADPISGTEAWEGSMTIDGIQHHIKPVHAYMREKTSQDPDVPMASLVRRGLLGGGTVILSEADAVASLEPLSCSHDKLHPNKIQQQKSDLLFAEQAYMSRVPSPWSVFSPHWLPEAEPHPDGASTWRVRGSTGQTHSLAKREDIAGNGNSSSYSSTIGDTDGCPKERKVVYIGVAADCGAVESFGGEDETKTSILSYVNSVSTVYANSFNVSIGVVEFSVMSSSCPSSTNASQPWNVACSSNSSSSSVDLNERLSLFSQWRSDKGGSDGAGLWHLLTSCSSGSEVGVAWLSTLCQVDATSSSGDVTSGTAVTSLTDRTWEVMAHEIGHNFGAIHDCSSTCSSSTDTDEGSSCCPLSTSTCSANANYIMSPVSEKNTTTFSPCSIGNICTTIQSSLNTTCLQTPGSRTTLSSQQCGNGILEPGEECDPGTSSSSCCNTSTCKLVSGAVCDPSNSACCTSSCAYASNSTVCRASINSECDPAEYCTGSSASCPSDEHTSDGTSCGTSGNGLSCAGGHCTSRNLQCQTEGASLNVTKACSAATSSSCQITCADPSTSSSCIVFESYFVDGTSCGLSGTCKSGSCEDGNVGQTVRAWAKRYPQYFYPIVIVGSLVILFMLFSIMRYCYLRSKRGRVPASAIYSRNAAARNKNRPTRSRPQNPRLSALAVPAATQMPNGRGPSQDQTSVDSRTSLMQEAPGASPVHYQPPPHPPPQYQNMPDRQQPYYAGPNRTSWQPQPSYVPPLPPVPVADQQSNYHPYYQDQYQSTQG